MALPYRAFIIPAFFLGASLGSFSAAAASRAAAGEKFFGLSCSKCAFCGSALSPRDLVPVLSFIFLRGRCRFCKERIPLRDFAAETACGLLCALFLFRFGLSYRFIFSSAMISFLAFHTITDIETGYIYDSWAFAASGTALLLRAPGGLGALFDGAAGGALGAAFIGAIIFLSRGRMGTGDATLMTGLGSFLGLHFTAAALYIGFMVGGFFALLSLAAGRAARETAVPLAPSLCAGCAAAVLFGGEITGFFGLAPRWPWIS